MRRVHPAFIAYFHKAWCVIALYDSCSLYTIIILHGHGLGTYWFSLYEDGAILGCSRESEACITCVVYLLSCEICGHSCALSCALLRIETFLLRSSLSAVICKAQRSRRSNQNGCTSHLAQSK